MEHIGLYIFKNQVMINISLLTLPALPDLIV